MDWSSQWSWREPRAATPAEHKGLAGGHKARPAARHSASTITCETVGSLKRRPHLPLPPIPRRSGGLSLEKGPQALMSGDCQ